MKKVVLFVLCCIATHCGAMADKGTDVEEIRIKLDQLSKSEKELDFFALYDLCFVIQFPSQELNPINEDNLKEKGLLEDDGMLKPMVKETLIEYVKEMDSDILLVSNDFEQ